MALLSKSLFVAGLAIAAGRVTVARSPEPRASACTEAPAAPSTTIDLPAPPFQALPSTDGCWVFVSLAAQPGSNAMIAVLRRDAGKLSFVRAVPLKSGAAGMALTHDGKLLVISGNQRVAFVDVAKLTAGRDAVLGYVAERSQQPLGRVYANVSPDDKYAFIADERARSVSVIDLARARASSFSASSIVGKIPTGNLPIALTFSHDGTLLYITSESATPDFGWPLECRREGANADTTVANPQGAILIVDAKRATTDPAHAVIVSVPAGCSPVRLVLSPAGDRAYVSARNSNALLAFDTQKLRSDPTHALIGRVPVGTAPVGVAVVDSGRKIIVTNSNRFAGARADRQSLTVIDATKLTLGEGAVVGSISAGAFPREMRVTPDGRALVLTNFGSRTVQLLDLARLPIDSVAR